MKYLITILSLFFLLSFTNTGTAPYKPVILIRDTVPTGAAPQLFGGKLYEFKNYALIDSFLMVMSGDTFAIPRWPALKYKGSDNRWYGYHGTQWRAFLNGTDTVSLSNRIDNAGISTTNVGAGFRLVATPTGSIKTLNPGYGLILDSVTATNTITAQADTSSANHLVTVNDLNEGISVHGIQSTLTAGDTALRQIIWKDTASATETNNLLVTSIIPSNNGTVYTNGEGGLFQSSIAKFSGVNPDGRPNVVYNLAGYNVTPGGGRINTNEAAFRLGLETHFQLGVGQNPAFEIHLPEVVTETGTSFRPFSMYILKESGLTNTDMQITQMTWKKQLDGNVDWGTFSYGETGTIFNQISEGNSMSNSHRFTLPGSIGTLNYDSTGFQITSNLVGTKIFATNMSIQYGDPSNLSGMDGYGSITHREGKLLVTNTGANTNLLELQHAFSQKLLITNTTSVFSNELLMNGQPIAMASGAYMYPAGGNALRFISSLGTGGNIIWDNGQSGARIMTMFNPLAAGGDGTNTNVNIGASTTNPGYRLRVQGSAYIDTNMFVAQHDIASNSDSAVTWDRSTGEYKFAKINGASATTLYNGDGTLTSDRNVSTGGFATVWSGVNDGEAILTVSNTGTTNASAISGSATGTSSTGISGTSSQYIGVFGTSTSSNGVQGQSTSGTGVVGVSSTGVGVRAQNNPTSTNAIENIITALRTSSSGAGANGLGAAIQVELETATNGNSETAGRLAFKWTDATAATYTSMFELYGANSAVVARKLAVAGSGQVTLDGYGANSFSVTPATTPVMSSSGVVGERIAPKVYTALISATAGNDPTATILGTNEIGSIVWTRNSAGNYTGTLSSAFTANKTWMVINQGPDGATGFVRGWLFYGTANTVTLRTQDNAGADVDAFTNIPIRIEVYP